MNPSTAAEPNKSFVLNLSNPSGTPLVNDQYSGLIRSNNLPTPAAGSLDFTFGWAGFAQGHPGAAAATDVANNLAVQANGKIVEVGSVTGSGGPAIGLARFNTDGTLDSTFGTGGTVSTPINSGPGPVTANAALVEPSGAILVVGGDGTNIVVARYLTSGLLDNTFGTAGIATIALPAADAGTSASWTGQRIALDSQGNIVIAAGGSSTNLGTFGAVIKLNFSGVQNLSFGSGGVALFKTGGSITIQSIDGLVVGAGDAITVSGSAGLNGMLGRLTSSGAQDMTFGSSGLVLAENTSGKAVNGLALQANGDIVTIGQSNASSSQYDVARYTPTGALDGTFGSGGVVTTSFANGSGAVGSNIAVLGDGKIVVSGNVQIASNPVSIALAQFNANGTPDMSFGTAGVVTDSIAGMTPDNVEMALRPAATW